MHDSPVALLQLHQFSGLPCTAYFTDTRTGTGPLFRKSIVHIRATVLTFGLGLGLRLCLELGLGLGLVLGSALGLGLERLP